ncbi:hypothetical protein SCUP515_08462 [Seiridium cupressi]
MKDKHTLSQSKKDRLQALLSELDVNAWFSRRWIIQVALNSNVALYCRRIELSWIDLVFLNGQFDFNHSLPKDSDIVQNLKRLAALWIRQSFPIHNILVNDSSSILSLLNLHDSAQCGDDKDRIFALLSLAHDVFPTSTNRGIAFDADYSQTVEQVYLDFAEAMARAGLLLPLMISNAGVNHDNSRFPRPDTPVLRGTHYHEISAAVACIIIKSTSAPWHRLHRMGHALHQRSTTRGLELATFTPLEVAWSSTIQSGPNPWHEHAVASLAGLWVHLRSSHHSQRVLGQAWVAVLSLAYKVCLGGNEFWHEKRPIPEPPSDAAAAATMSEFLDLLESTGSCRRGLCTILLYNSKLGTSSSRVPRDWPLVGYCSFKARAGDCVTYFGRRDCWPIRQSQRRRASHESLDEPLQDHEMEIKYNATMLLRPVSRLDEMAKVPWGEDGSSGRQVALEQHIYPYIPSCWRLLRRPPISLQRSRSPASGY